jgi:hypothetical protein
MFLYFCLILPVFGFQIYDSTDGIKFSPRGTLSEDKASSHPTSHLQTAAGNYYIEIRSDNQIFHSSLPLVLLQNSNFQETFTLHKDTLGTIYHIDYQTKNTSVKKSNKFISTVVIKNTEPGEMPVLVKPVSEELKNAQNQSFIIKYWYLIVPAVLFLLFTSPEEEGK